MDRFIDKIKQLAKDCEQLKKNDQKLQNENKQLKNNEMELRKTIQDLRNRLNSQNRGGKQSNYPSDNRWINENELKLQNDIELYKKSEESLRNANENLIKMNRELKMEISQLKKNGIYEIWEKLGPLFKDKVLEYIDAENRNFFEDLGKNATGNIRNEGRKSGEWNTTEHELEDKFPGIGSHNTSSNDTRWQSNVGKPKSDFSTSQSTQNEYHKTFVQNDVVMKRGTSWFEKDYESPSGAQGTSMHASVYYRYNFPKTAPRLLNTGSNCYLNSALQGIASCNLFIDEIRDLLDKYNLPKLENFYKLIFCLNSTNDKSPFDARKQSIFQEWIKFGQQDSFEVLSYVVNQVYTEIRSQMNKEGKCQTLEEWLEVKLPMRLQILYSMNCECGYVDHCPMQTDLAIHVAIPEGNRNIEYELKDLMDRHFRGERIEGYVCCNCQGKNVTKQTRLRQPLPSTFCIHLQRTVSHNYTTYLLNNTVRFQTSLFLENRYFSDGKGTNNVYHLRSVIIHYGSEFSGHYICNRFLDKSWYSISDSFVQQISVDEVLKSKPLVLFYEAASNI